MRTMWLILSVSVFLIGTLRMLFSGRGSFSGPVKVDPEFKFALDNVDTTTYVRIDDQGHAWELSDDELEYLRTRFHPNDGARPYVKQTYDQRTPDGRLSGFLRTKDLPSGHEISRNTRP